MSATDGPLVGTRVVDLTHLIAGPYCTMLLADAGADVIKVESPAGDIARRRIPFLLDDGTADASGYFLACNRGKRSITLDLKNRRGVEVLHRLLDRADVLVENYRPGVLDRLGLDIDTLRQRHPELIVASISVFGKTGVPDELQAVPGLAIVAEAMSGVTSRARDADGQPVWCGFPLGDYTGGLTAYSAILAALLRRIRENTGEWLDISMTDAMLALSGSALACRTFEGSELPDPDVLTAPYGVFPASDGHVAIGVNSDAFWQRMCEAMGRPDLAADERLATQAGRAANSRLVVREVQAWTTTLTTEQVVQQLQAPGVPVSPVNQMDDVARSKLFESRGMLANVSTGTAASALVPGSAQGYRPTVRAPRLGEHNREVLAEVVGADGAAIDELQAEGAFGVA